MNTVFYIGGNRYRLMAGDARALRFIMQIASEARSDDRPTWLLRYRDEIASIQQRRPRAAITQLALTTTHRDTRKLALWFRGRCGGTLGANELLRRALPDDQELRFHTARCLYAMGAWAQLRELSASLPDTLWSRRFVATRPRRPFASRLERFLAHAPKNNPAPHASPPFMDLRTSDNVGKPAKPVWLIRLVLDRIRFLVSGRYSQDRLPTHFYDEAS